MTRIRSRQAEGREGIRDDIRSRGEVFTRSGRQIHDALDAAQHVGGFPPGHRHILHRGGGL